MSYDWNSLKQGLQKGVGEKSGDKNYDDPREWKLAVDENDNGTAVIRLLPGKGGNTPPIVRVYEHSARMFDKASNKYRYYIEPSPSTINEPCPMSEIWYELGDIGTEEAQKMQKNFSRAVKFIANILVVNDPANPENNGKVFYWKFGVKLFEKFQAALEPTEAQIKVGKKPIELFDPMRGANIILEAKKVAGFRNYDDTTIEAPSAAFNSEDEVVKVVTEDCIDLNEFISPDHFKSYQDLKGKLAWLIEKSPVEQLLLASGSKVITEAYVPRNRQGHGGQAQSQAPQAQADSATPMGGSYQMPQQEAQAPAPQPEPTPAPTPEPAPQAQPEAPKEDKPASSASDEDILSMLDDL